MATLDVKTGQIRDRRKGYPRISYYVPKASISFMKQCLKAHNMLVLLIGSSPMPKDELKTMVMRYAMLDPNGKTEIIRSLALRHNPCNASKPKESSMKEIAEAWLERKFSEGVSGKHKLRLKAQKDIILRFFDESRIITTSGLGNDTACDYVKWRSRNCQTHDGASASVIKHELQILRQMARMAYRNGCIADSNLWDDVKVKAIAGVNKKVVEPLTIEEQKGLLRKLEGTPHHDTALLLLITGMRLGELRGIGKDSIQNGALTLHGNGIGNFKPMGGKTASSPRTLPACPTLEELFNRGNIFKSSPKALQMALNRNFKGIHPHRLRHAFAVNKLLAQTPLQMVSYQMGHSKISLTADLYGKFVPEHFKAGFEETIRIRKEHLDWLESKYFARGK